MKRDTFTIPLALPGELIIDNFAGGGGTSTGLEAAFGRPVDIAINHNAEALAMHAANHPHTLHLCESVWDVDPIAVTKNQPVGLVWLSPDCKHFSKAKGGKPVEKKIRGLAWVALRWAAKCKPRVIMLENVEEFKTWGPLQIDAEGNARPDPTKKGQTFNSFVRQLRGLGYQVDWSELRACDYGTPTIRKRFFLVARRDGLPIVSKPKATHAAPASKEAKAGKLMPWRTAAECIDWSIPCPSIFDRKKPLADATLRRIAKGVMRYVVESTDPFIVRIGHTGHGDSGKVRSLDDALSTITSKAEHLLVAPVLSHYHADKRDADVRASDVREPVKTQTSENRHALVSAFLAKHYTGVVGSGLDTAMGTVTGVDHHSLVTAALVGVGARAGQSRPRGIEEPTATICAKYDTALVTAHVTKFRKGSVGSAIDEPLHTVTAGGQQARPGTGNAMGIVVSNLVKLRGDNVGQPTDEPLATVSAQGTHHAEVRAFLLSYYGTDQNPDIAGPLATVTSRDRFGLVTIKGQDYQIVDIGLRMLSPRELFKAQGFPASYIIGDDETQGLKLTKSAQVRMCGNSVCPPMAEALVRANFAHEAQIYGRAAA
jgi:DNA (cytosine-5)-methyltransferase 1